MRPERRKLLYSIGLSCLAGALALAPFAIAQRPPRDVVRAFTEPYQRLSLNFPNMGLIKEVAVKDSQTVKVGDLLMAQDDDIEQDEYKRLKAESDSKARMEYAQADLDTKIVQLKRIVEAPAGTYSPLEMEQAKLEMVRSEKQLDVSKLDQLGNELKTRQQKTRLDKMKLHSNVNGIVESIKVRTGELSVPQYDRPAIVVVQNDPCYVVLTDLTSQQVSTLQLGETFQVKYADDTEWRMAKVATIAPVARAESNMQIVKLELPNPENRSTGLPIEVKLPEKLLKTSGPAAALNR